jgi:hypothetical protein
MSLAVRLFVIDYAFIQSSGKAPAELSASFCLLLGVNGVLESNRQYRDPKESLSAVSDAGGVGDRLVPSRFVRGFVQEKRNNLHMIASLSTRAQRLHRN